MENVQGPDNEFLPEDNGSSEPEIDYPNIKESKETLQVSAGEDVREPEEEATAVPYKFYLEYDGYGDKFLVDGPFDSREEAVEAWAKVDMPPDWLRDYLSIEKMEMNVVFDREDAKNKLAAMRSAKSATFDYTEFRRQLVGALKDVLGLSLDSSIHAAETDEVKVTETLDVPSHHVMDEPVEAAIHTRSITEILDRCVSLASVLQNVLDPVLSPPTGQVDEAEDYGAGAKCQVMNIYNTLTNIMERLAL